MYAHVATLSVQGQNKERLIVRHDKIHNLSLKMSSAVQSRLLHVNAYVKN